MYYSNNDVRVQELPIPQLGDEEVLMRVEASGICGTDVMEWYRRDRVPLVLGHEVAGEVVAVGDNVRRYKKGDRICASHHVPCNSCHYCLSGHHTVCNTMRQTNFDPGGFAEYIRLPAINVKTGIYPLPDEVSFEEATFIEPLSCVLRGQRIAGMKEGKTVLIIGSGVSGLLHIKLARVRGASRIIATDVNDYRLKAAKRFGADVVIDAKGYTPLCLCEVNDGNLADIVVICTQATQACTQALESVDRGGTVLFFAATDKGVTIPLSVNNIFWRNEITLTSSYAGSPDDHIEALGLIRSQQVCVSEIITHRLSLDEIECGFKLVADARDSIKVIIEPQKVK